jgi:GT2 family glycosyltransferase
MKIQVIIPAINLWSKYTKPCIDSIKSKHELRIFLINNGSTDETKVEAPKLVSDRFAHHRNEVAWSCAKSWNFGVKDAWEHGADYVLVINNDVLLHGDCIDRLVERLEKRTEGVVMATAMDIKGECTSPEALFLRASKDFEDRAEAEHPNFSAFMITKKFSEVVGEFEEGFSPAYFEDNDAHRRINLSGLKAIVYPPALFYHYGSRTTNETTINGKPVVTPPMFERNRAFYIEKWGGLPGEEKFTSPFNSAAYSLKAVKQLFK